ncbi:hypothetical protein H1P_310039 [Hyella patelloides LEGE 07179]|uniref:Uncharacterized protein n=1 Tax=Hyella patelloides LEGE 07179 TaxID=945734 RepID=A0A563VUQ8_9CYAN|nr:hypothetical protein H1P_310039 [Hyella patelloides LEGE 07179]
MIMLKSISKNILSYFDSHRYSALKATRPRVAQGNARQDTTETARDRWSKLFKYR